MELFSTWELTAGFTEQVESELGRISVSALSSDCRIKSGVFPGFLTLMEQHVIRREWRWWRWPEHHIPVPGNYRNICFLHSLERHIYLRYNAGNGDQLSLLGTRL